MHFKDQLGRIITTDGVPKRIVSLVPSQTELLVDLGLRDEIVGITKFCVHPTALRKEKTVVGGTKNVKSEKVAALKPDIIIANKEENTLQMVEELTAIAPIWVSDIYTVADSLDFIESMGQLFGKEAAAKETIAGIVTARTTFLDHIKERKTLKVAYLIWKNPYMAAGCKTFINALLADNNYENFFDEPGGRYPEVSLEQLKTADLILLSSEPYPFKEQDRLELEQELGKPVLLIDGEYFSWYGSRLKGAYEYFKHLH